MSPTIDDLRLRMADELDELPALPDLTGPAIAGGRRRERRRRYAVALGAAGLVAAATVPVGMLANGQGSGRPAPAPGQVATDRGGTATPRAAEDRALTRAAARRAAAEADGVVTRAEWDTAVTATFDALLPARFGGVVLTDNEAVPVVRTRAGAPPMELGFGLGGIAGPIDVQPGYGGCARVRQAITEVDFRWDLLDCGDARFDGFHALATSSYTIDGAQSDSVGQEQYAGSLILLEEGLFVEVGIRPTEAAPVPITTEELLALAQDDDFLDLVRVGVIYTRDRESTHGAALETADPTWPR